MQEKGFHRGLQDVTGAVQQWLPHIGEAKVLSLQSSPDLAPRSWRIAGELLVLTLVMKRHSNRVGGLANECEGKQVKTKVCLFHTFSPGYHQEVWPQCRASLPASII